MKPATLSFLLTARTSVGADVLTETLLRAVADLAVREAGGMPADGRDDAEAKAGVTALTNAVLALLPDSMQSRLGTKEAGEAFLAAAEVAYDSVAPEVGHAVEWPLALPIYQSYPRDLVRDLGQVYGYCYGATVARLERQAGDHAAEAAHNQ